ncbi:beta-amylase 2 [Tanacetum coccineum]
MPHTVSPDWSHWQKDGVIRYTIDSFGYHKNKEAIRDAILENIEGIGYPCVVIVNSNLLREHLIDGHTRNHTVQIVGADIGSPDPKDHICTNYQDSVVPVVRSANAKERHCLPLRFWLDTPKAYFLYMLHNDACYMRSKLAVSILLQYVLVVMSFHKCGGNVGDDVHIPLPKWIIELGRTAVEVYVEYIRSFRVEFDEFFEDGSITEIEIGLGACVELRYPSYPAKHGWK